jgi:anti-sigma factor RsiW
MKCPREFGEGADLLAYVAGRLDEPRAAALERHMESCGHCRDFVAGQQAVWQALDAWEAAPVSSDFDRNLYRLIEQKGSWWNRLLDPLRLLPARRLVPVAAALCLVAAAGWIVEQRPAPQRRQAPGVAKVDSLQPDQVEHALDDMQMLSDFTHATRSDAGEL